MLIWSFILEISLIQHYSYSFYNGNISRQYQDKIYLHVIYVMIKSLSLRADVNYEGCKISPTHKNQLMTFIGTVV